MKKILINLSIICIILSFLACSGNGAASNNTSNGILAFKQSSVMVTNGSVTELNLTLSGSTEVSGLVVTLSSSNPTVATVIPAVCILSSAPASPQSCEVQVRGLATGSANIIATASGYNVSSVAVISSSSPVVGALAFDITSESVSVNSSNHVLLSLNGSSGVSNLVVTLSSTNSSIATVSPATCTLSSGLARSCEITINGVAQGTISIMAAASGYIQPTPVSVNVVSMPIAGTLSFTSTSVSVGVSTSTQVILSLNHSSGITNLPVSLSLSNKSFAIESPSICTLSSGPIVRQCTVTLQGTAVGSATMNAMAANYSITPVNVTVTQAYVPKTQFGVYNNCPYSVWMQAINPPISSESLVMISSKNGYDYSINGQLLNSFNVFPKTGCDSNGINCLVGQSLPPAPIYGGVQYGQQPPIDSLFEGTFNNNGNYYDGSAVNGYTIPFNISVSKGVGENSPTCIGADASKLTITACPTNDDISTPTNLMSVYGSYAFGPFPIAYESYDNSGNGVAGPHNMTSVNLQISNPSTGSVIGCAAPATIVNNYPGWGTLGIASRNSAGYAANWSTPVIMYTCPYITSQLLNPSTAPSIQPGESAGFKAMSNYCLTTGACLTNTNPNGPQASQTCNLGPINHTQYVTYLNNFTTAIYTQTYNDARGGLECNSTSSRITFTLCP